MTRSPLSRHLTAIVASLGLAAAAQAAPTTLDTYAAQYGTILSAGPRPATSGNRFWNIQGSGNPANASDGTLRFDLTAIRDAFDVQYGAGAWSVTDVRIELSQSNAAFTANGGVSVYHFTNDSLAITNGENDGAVGGLLDGDFGSLPVSTLTFGAWSSNPAQFGTLTQVDSFMFSEVANGHIDVLGITGTPGLESGSNLNVGVLAGDIESTDFLSLIFVAAEAGTTATYKGNAFGGINPPRIFITADIVPEPASLGLLGLGALLIARRRVA